VLLLTVVWGMAGFLAFVPLYALDLGLPGSGWLFLFAGTVVAIRSVGARLPDRLGAVRALGAALTCTRPVWRWSGCGGPPPGSSRARSRWGLGLPWPPRRS